ncbi:MAG TPA: CoA transferase [Ramlibacter sp.]|nr:CoA transferase [Ramlibacter sp.]
MSNLPLEGIRVIDFTQVMMGPVCTQVLADYGADVIKIERAPAGDLSRSTFESVAGADNPVFASLNRNKRSVAVNLKDPEQLQAVRALVADADVVVNNFRAGVMERLGLGYEDCKALNARIIYAVGTGFGEGGPLSHKGGQDVLAQALTGVMARRADEALPISIYPTTLADYTAGMHLAQGILLALVQRGRTGEGQKLSVSLYNSMLAMQMQEAAMLMMQDSDLNWAAMPLTGVFQAENGAFVLVGAFKENPLRSICKAIGIPDLSEEPKFATLGNQIANKKELQSILAKQFQGASREHWLSRLEQEDLLCAPVLDLRDALQAGQTAYNRIVMEERREDRHYRLVGSPISLASAPVTMRHEPPRLGQHTSEVMALARRGVRQ